ncbi:MAG: glycoside hydrolase family 2 TIM barrel-domain containing protein [bacterium]|nr:glycoside hydrolase family 2 TIM barrel-domain containing protein [bacterium]
MKRGSCVFTVILFLFTFNLPALLATEPLQLFEPGTEEIIDYSRYGEFRNIGTSQYSYLIKDREGLARAAGEGVFPNASVLKDPVYKQLLKQGKLKGRHWDFVDTKDHRLNFYKWATAPESPDVKQYYTAIMFERLGMLKEAVKAYYSVVVHYPKGVSYTYWNSPFYLAQTCMDRIEILCRRNPDLGIKLVGARVTVRKGFDIDRSNDEIIVAPGRLIKVNRDDAAEKRREFSRDRIIKTIGGQKVKLVKYDSGHWQLLVDDKPFLVKALAYSPNMIGLSPHTGTVDPVRDWQNQDINKNNRIDGPYDSWVDANNNDQQDPDEKPVGDARLLHDMGCNTIRIYSHVLNQQLFRDLYKQYGLMLMIGDMAGCYATESGATWEKGTDYEDPKQIKRMLANIEKMVKENKDEPYTLCWVLGNENVYGVGNNSDKKPEAFYKFIGQAVDLIHKLDPGHPVAICNGDLKFLDILAGYAPQIDIFGCNAYRGSFGFGRSLFNNVKEIMDKPVIITEYGCSAYADGFTQDEIFNFQSEYHRNNWEDIEYNSCGSGSGNALGGVAFEWLDEWWKANEDLPDRIKQQKKVWYEKRQDEYNKKDDLAGAFKHDSVPQFGAPFLDGWSYEEWYGFCSQGDGYSSPFKRQLRPVYEMYRKVWNK